MSMAMANQIRELERQVAELTKRVEVCEQRLDAQAHGYPDPEIDPIPIPPKPASLADLDLVGDADDDAPGASG